MSGTDTAIAELNEPAAEPDAPRPRGPPRCRTCPSRNAREAIAWYVDTFGASLVGEPYRDGRRPHRARRAAIGGGVLYLADEYPELGLKAPAPQATSVSLMLHVADTDATLERARDRGARRAAGAVRELRRPQRHDHRPVRASLDAQRTGDRRARCRSSTATSATSRCGRPTPTAPRRSTATCSGWTYDPATHQVTNTKQHIGIFSVGRTAARCSAATRWPTCEGARQAILDGGGTGRRTRSSSTSARVLGATDPQGTAFARVPAGPGRAAPRAQWHWARRTFVHHLRGGRLGGLQGVLQPGAVLDLRARPDRRRLAGAADPSDGRRRGRQHRSR